MGTININRAMISLVNGLRISFHFFQSHCYYKLKLKMSVQKHKEVQVDYHKKFIVHIFLFVFAIRTSFSAGSSSFVKSAVTSLNLRSGL